MKIYIAHSRNFDFLNELYSPIKSNFWSEDYIFIFPHDDTDELFNSRELFENGCDLIIAEVSYPATGLGIELGWANILQVPIVCLYKKGSEISGSLKTVSNKFLEYSSSEELIQKIKEAIENFS